MTDTVLYRVADRIAHITMNRPEAANAFDLPMGTAMVEAVAQASADADVGAVLISGAGKRFCAGGDLAAMATAEDRPAFIQELADTAHEAVLGLQRIDKPVVVAVQGAAAGIGLSLVLGADMVIATRSAKFVTAYTTVGLSPDGGMSWLLPRVVGQRRAIELLITSEPVDAESAHSLGIVSEVCEDDALAQTALVTATTLAGRPTHALASARRLVRESYSRTLEEHLPHEAAGIATASGHPVTEALINRFLGRS